MLTRRQLLNSTRFAAAAATALSALPLADSRDEPRGDWDFDPKRHRLAVFALGVHAIYGVGHATKQPPFPFPYDDPVLVPVAITWAYDDIPGDIIWGRITLDCYAEIASDVLEHLPRIKKPQPWHNAALAQWITQVQLESSWRGLLNQVDRALLAVDPDCWETMGAAEAVARSLRSRAVPTLCLAGPLRGDLVRGDRDVAEIFGRLRVERVMLRPAWAYAALGPMRASPEEKWLAAVRECTKCG